MNHNALPNPEAHLPPDGLGGVVMREAVQQPAVTREEVDAYEAEASQRAALAGGYRVPRTPGPAPRPGVDMKEHVQQLRNLGYHF